MRPSPSRYDKSPPHSGSNTKPGKENDGRGVKEKQHGSANDAAKDTINVVTSIVDEYVVKNLGSNNVNTTYVNMKKPLESREGNVGQCSTLVTNNAPLLVNDTVNVNLEIPLASNKGDDVNSNANLEPTASATLPAYVSFAKLLKENGPWFICNNSFILKKWDPDVNLFKEDVSNDLIWVKLHGVPMTTFNEDGLSVIATKLDTPFMLDSYTSDMCIQSWGRSSYVRAMIEIQADVELKDTIVVAMLKLVDLVKNSNNLRQATRGVPVGPKGKVTFLDDDENPLVSTCYVDSKSEVEVVFDETTNLLDSMSSKGGNDRGYGNNTLLEQWRKTNRDDDYDSYDEDLYESHDMFDHLQVICDNLDIMICSRKKK
ncbi:putative reverse transcriptase domain-containing protein [Tanacetum coccineum]